MPKKVSAQSSAPVSGDFKSLRSEMNLWRSEFAAKPVANRNSIRKTQEGCGGLGGENPGAFPQAGPIFQQPFPLPANVQALAGIALRAAGKSVNHFPAASKFAGKLFQQGISDSHSLLEFSDSMNRAGSAKPLRT